MRFFNSYIASIFLYNSELWSVNKKIEKLIDIFHRSLLRKINKIKYPYVIKNNVLYNRTNEKPWSEVIKIRRLRWTGHLLRLPENAPAKLALNEINQTYKINKKTCRKTWKKIVNEDLKTIDITYSIDGVKIKELAEDREQWHRKVVYKASAMSTQDGTQP